MFSTCPKSDLKIAHNIYSILNLKFINLQGGVVITPETVGTITPETMGTITPLTPKLRFFLIRLPSVYQGRIA